MANITDTSGIDLQELAKTLVVVYKMRALELLI